MQKASSGLDHEAHRSFCVGFATAEELFLVRARVYFASPTLTDPTVDRVLALNLTLIRIPQRQQILFAIVKILRKFDV